jgi:hypothetical protein
VRPIANGNAPEERGERREERGERREERGEEWDEEVVNKEGWTKRGGHV